VGNVSEESPQAIAAKVDDERRELFRWMRDDAEAMLAARHSWPDHLPYEVVSAATWRWAAGAFSAQITSPAVHRFAREWPLPVGRRSLFEYADRTMQTRISGDPAYLHDLMPLADNELAALILTTQIDSASVETFGMAIRDGDSDPDTETYKPSGVAFRITGLDPTSGRVQAFTRNARDWWTTLGGTRIRGRPYGSTVRNLDDYRFEYREVVKRLGQAPRSQSQFCDVSGIPIDTMKRNFRAWGILWSSFRDECSAHSYIDPYLHREKH
jgi:hypothetical protein